MIFHKILSDRKFLSISTSLQSILANLNHTVVWGVMILPLISNSFSLFPGPLETVPSAPTTIGITIILIFYCFF